jgi:hypothetical protein
MGSGFRDEKPVKYPACFIEFIIEETNSLPLGIVDYMLTVRFRFGIESYKFQRIETFDFCDQFLAEVQLMAPSSDSGLTFTTLQLMKPEFDEDHNNVESPYLDFRTRYRSDVAYQRAKDRLATGVTPITQPLIVTAV